MSAEEISLWADLVNRVGIISVVVLVLLAMMFLWARTTANSQERHGRMSEENQAELVQLRKDYKKVVEDKFILEQKYTTCQEALARMEGRYDLLDSKNQTAVEKFLDDTQDLDREMLMLRVTIKTLESNLKDKDALIALLHARIEGIDLNGAQ